MLVGYARVSTHDQNLDLQRDALARAGGQRVFEEKKSGTAAPSDPSSRPPSPYLRPDDVRVIWKLDRLGRSLVETMPTIDGLRRQEVHFRSLTEQFDSDTAHGRFARQVHGAMAEYFLALSRERTLEGHRAALARGRKGGRLKAPSEGDFEVGRALRASGTISVAAIAKRLGVSRMTFYQDFPQARARNQVAGESWEMPIRREPRGFDPIDRPQLSTVIASGRPAPRLIAVRHCRRQFMMDG
ncbi:Resolvase domain [Methylobacterium sp. 4-46]|uniref:recombinase family protein n=1 Tax=unclassified Methylobacterium TaxID=2615210 RepID=UPI000165CA1C|nr:Resolvase domain [Methylobacterium sp. 4-46]